MVKLSELSSVANACKAVLNWTEAADGLSFDPYDLRAKRRDVFGINVPLRGLDIANRICPVYARRFFGVVPTSTVTGYAHMLSGYCHLSKLYPSRASNYAKKAYRIVEWLKCNRSDGGGWGLPFDWTTGKGVIIPAGATLSYTTYTALAALLEFSRITSDKRLLKYSYCAALESIEQLNLIQCPNGVLLSYSKYDDYEVNNTNALLGAVIGELAIEEADTSLGELATKIISQVVSEQNSDGSWNYFARRYSSGAYIDNYHSAMTLHGLARASASVPSAGTIMSSIERGVAYYEREFLRPSFLGSVWPRRKYPKDVASCSEGILLGAILKRVIEPRIYTTLRQKFAQLVEFSIAEMQDADGGFIMRLYPANFKTRLKSIRWCSGPMLHALLMWLATEEKDLSEYNL